MKKIIAVAKRVANNEKAIAVYTIVSLLIMMLVATSENIPMILVSVINLFVAVKMLNRIEDKRMP